jgi:hypothetical protein
LLLPQVSPVPSLHRPLPSQAQALVALQSAGAEQVLGAVVSVLPGLMLPQVPSVPVVIKDARQVVHTPEHALLQQTDSTQFVLAQFSLRVHAPPRPPQSLLAGQVLLAHSLAAVQTSPFAFRQAPLGPQAASPEQGVVALVSCTPSTVMAAHVPSAPPVRLLEHAMQVPVHAVAQHTPSTQCPFAHSPSAPQVWPSASLHAPLPLHAQAVAVALTEVQSAAAEHVLGALGSGLLP